MLNRDKDLDPIYQIPILSIELYLCLEKERSPPEVLYKNSLVGEMIREWTNIHNKALFDAINEALDEYRPFGLKGPPLPWTNKTRPLTFQSC